MYMYVESVICPPSRLILLSFCQNNDRAEHLLFEGKMERYKYVLNSLFYFFYLSAFLTFLFYLLYTRILSYHINLFIGANTYSYFLISIYLFAKIKHKSLKHSNYLYFLFHRIDLIKHNPHYRKYKFTEFDRYILMRIWRILAIKYYPLEMAKNTLKRHFLI